MGKAAQSSQLPPEQAGCIFPLPSCPPTDGERRNAFTKATEILALPRWFAKNGASPSRARSSPCHGVAGGGGRGKAGHVLLLFPLSSPGKRCPLEREASSQCISVCTLAGSYSRAAAGLLAKTLCNKVEKLGRSPEVPGCVLSSGCPPRTHGVLVGSPVPRHGWSRAEPTALGSGCARCQGCRQGRSLCLDRAASQLMGLPGTS